MIYNSQHYKYIGEISNMKRIRKERHGEIFRCDICNKFISYKELDNKEVKVDFVPDTEFTIEKTTFTHKKCLTDE